MADQAESAAADADGQVKPTYSVPDDFFVLKGPGSTNQSWLYLCKKCVGNKMITASYKSRFNLRQHVKSKHTPSLKTFDKVCNDNRKRKVPDDDSIMVIDTPRPSGSATHSTPTSTKQCQYQPSILDRLTTAKSKLTQKQLDSYIVKYIAESVLPFYHVESDAFKTFVQHLSPGMIIKTSKTYQKMAEGEWKNMKENLIDTLGKARKVCLTLDHWSSHRKGYLGVTAHWYEGSQCVRKHACIALRRIRGRVTFDVLAKEIDAILVEYGLSSTKVTHCVTDSGSNFVKTFKEFSVPCPSSSDSESPSDTEENDEAQALNAESVQEVLLSEPLEEEDPLETSYELPLHFKCAAHRLNLIAATDSTRGLESPVCKKIYRSLLAKLQAIWNKQSRSVVTSDKIKETLNGLLVVPNATRWNSTYDAMVRFHKLHNAQEAKMNTLFIHLDLRPITDDEKKFLTEFIQVMTPLSLALDELQGQNTVSAGYLLPTLYNVIEEWERLDSLTLTNELKAILTRAVKTRFAAELESDHFKLAAALHPRFHMYWVQDGDVDYVEALVRKTLQKYQEQECTTATGTTVQGKYNIPWLIYMYSIY